MNGLENPTFLAAWIISNTVALLILRAAVKRPKIARSMLFLLFAWGWWVKWACIGTIIFLAAIAPLGVGAGFPFSVTVSIAAWFIIRRDDLDYLWNSVAREKYRAGSPA